MARITFRVDNPSLKRPERPSLTLDGEWQVLVDPRPGTGHTEEFYSPEREFTLSARVPGCWQGQTGAGVANAFHANYRSTAFYKRFFDLPTGWTQRRIWLRLGGVAPATDVWLNGQHLGFTCSSRTPLKLDISETVELDATNELVIKVSRPHLRLDGTWDYPNGGWEGIYRSVSIATSAPAWIDDAFVSALGLDGGVQFQLNLGSRDGEAGLFHVTVDILSPASADDGGDVVASGSWPVRLAADGLEQIGGQLNVPDPRFWAPQHPTLYEARITLRRGNRVVDQVRVRFGLRQIVADGNRLYLNGHPLFLRGFGWNIGYYPRTICPPNDKGFYEHRIHTAREYGFNFTKTELEAVVPEMLEAADELGLLVAFEMPFGMNGEHRQARYDPPVDFAALWEQELRRLILQSRNHPSIIIYGMASELQLDQQTERSFQLFNQRFPRLSRQLAPHVLVADTTSGAGIRLETVKGRRETDIMDQHYWRDVLDPVTPIGRAYGSGLHGSETKEDQRAKKALWIGDAERPFLFHEYLWWSQFPDVALKPKYEGHPMRPYWLDEAEQIAERQGLAHLLPVFAHTSERLLAICRKEGIEFARAQSDACGFVLYMLLDMTWSAEGLLDDFGDPKSVVGPTDFRRSNADTVLLLRDGSQRCLWRDAPFELDLAVSHYGEVPLANVRLQWQILDCDADDQSPILTGSQIVDIDAGAVESILRQHVRLPADNAAAPLLLHAELHDEHGTPISANDWRLWAFPRRPGDLVHCAGRRVACRHLPAGWRQRYPWQQQLAAGSPIEPDIDLLVTAGPIDEPLQRYLAQGGKVLALSTGSLPEVRQRYCDLFRTVPWNTGTQGNSGTVIRAHPALDGFPCGDLCDLQFVHLIKGTWPLDLNVWRPTCIDPIIRSIDHYRQGRWKAYIYETRVGQGSLLATSLDLLNRFDSEHPEAIHLADGLLRYAQSSTFNPQATIEPARFAAVLEAWTHRSANDK